MFLNCNTIIKYDLQVLPTQITKSKLVKYYYVKVTDVCIIFRLVFRLNITQTIL